jgi:hypothetical protein
LGYDVSVKAVKILIYLLAAICGLISFSCSTSAQLIRTSGTSGHLYALSETTLKLKDKTLLRWSPLAQPGELDYESRFRFTAAPPLFSPFGSAQPEQRLIGIKPRHAGIRPTRAWLLGTANAGVIFFGFRQAIASWGESKGGFHLKHDWDGDGLAQIDELSHLMWGYKMTQFLFWAYRWAGFSSRASHAISISQTALVLTMVEYPIDAYNPKQGLGVSDLIFDYAGIGLAYMKQRHLWLGDFDLKISWRRNIFLTNQPVFAQTYDQFDNFIYWLTYRRGLFLPRKVFCFGLGYGVSHKGDEPNRQFFGGIGLSLPDLLSLFGKGLGRRIGFLEIFYPHLSLRL